MAPWEAQVGTKKRRMSAEQRNLWRYAAPVGQARGGRDYPRRTARRLQKPLAGGAFFQMDQTAPPDQAVLRHVGERREDANLDRGFGLCAGGDRAQTAQSGGAPLHIATGNFGDGIRKDRGTGSIFSISRQIRYCTR